MWRAGDRVDEAVYSTPILGSNDAGRKLPQKRRERHMWGRSKVGKNKKMAAGWEMMTTPADINTVTDLGGFVLGVGDPLPRRGGEFPLELDAGRLIVPRGWTGNRLHASGTVVACWTNASHYLSDDLRLSSLAHTCESAIDRRRILS